MIKYRLCTQIANKPLNLLIEDMKVSGAPLERTKLVGKLCRDIHIILH